MNDVQVYRVTIRFCPQLTQWLMEAGGGRHWQPLGYGGMAGEVFREDFGQESLTNRLESFEFTASLHVDSHVFVTLWG